MSDDFESDFQPTLHKSYDEKIRPFIDAIDNLRTIGLNDDISLPQIVVIGDQSSGKSSTLEALSKIQLPRGDNLVTRCPLTLQMKRNRQVLPDDPPLITIKYKKPNRSLFQKTITADDVGKAVQEAQNELAGPGKNITGDEITLEVFSGSVPDLTLVDLPGIARNREVNGRSIADVTKDLINKYIEKKSTIILVVIPCTQDIDTAEALGLAKRVDPNGERTLGVLTKPDTCGEGSEGSVLRTLENKSSFPLSKGYFMIKCRSQQDLKVNKTLQTAIAEEEAFFKNHVVFRKCHQKSRLGTNNLAKKLSSELSRHIKVTLPNLKRRMRQLKEATDVELKTFGDAVPVEDDGKRTLLTSLLEQLKTEVSKATGADGTTTNCGIYYHSRPLFSKLEQRLSQVLCKAKEPELLKIIECKMVERRGSEHPDFLNFQVFKDLIRELLKETVHKPVEECLVAVSKQVCDQYSNVFNWPSLSDRFMDLKIKLQEKFEELYNEAYNDAFNALKVHFAMEDLVYTSDDNIQISNNPSASSARLMLDKIQSYYNIAQKRLRDLIPMIVIHHLFEGLRQNVLKYFRDLSGDPEVLKLLKENEQNAIDRDELKKKLERLKKGEQELKDVGNKI